MDRPPAPSTQGGRRSVLLGAGLLLGVVGLLAWPRLVGDLLATQGYMPHGHCYLWQPGLVGLHLVSDTLIGVAYLAISMTLVFLVYRARTDIPFHWMFLAFGAFILACGATHFMEVWTLWTPSYWLSGNVKLVTAVASVTTAVVLPPLVPRVLQLVRAEKTAEAQRTRLVIAEERAKLLASEQKAREEAEAARALAEAASHAKDQFLATVSHELRNPLSPILSWSRMLRTGDLDAAHTRQAIEAIERCATWQAQLIDDLLDVSRIVSGKLRMDVRPLDLCPIVQAALDSARLAADAKQIRLYTVLDPRSGPIAGDPERLQQVVWNLLSNAIKFTPRGGRVQVRLERVNSHVELTVSDTGEGIEPSLLPHLFERFWQAGSGTTRRHGGLGLGLAIVRHIVELHGGTVRAESEGLRRGSLFHVMLPLMATTEREMADAERRHPGAGDAFAPVMAPDLGSVRVLVVDDEPNSNEAVRTVLSRCGAEVRVAASAPQAIEILDRWRPDVLVSDIGMPGEDGYALIARVRARPADRGGTLPALALTAFARSDDRVRTLAAGFQMHVAKPVDPSELAVAVARLAGRPVQGSAPR
jgi:signal transduction histidine kinase/ActR/RegA family two-component response regulator